MPTTRPGKKAGTTKLCAIHGKCRRRNPDRIAEPIARLEIPTYAEDSSSRVSRGPAPTDPSFWVGPFAARPRPPNHRDMEHKTKLELASLISSRIGVRPTEIAVFSSESLGWDAMLLTRPRQAFKAAQMVKDVAAELRAKYELRDRSSRR